MKAITILTASFMLATPLVHANTTNTATAAEYALQLIKETCAIHVKQAAKSLEAADLAQYCLTTGEAIALQASQTPSEKMAVKKTINDWIESTHPTLAIKY